MPARRRTCCLYLIWRYCYGCAVLGAQHRRADEAHAVPSVGIKSPHPRAGHRLWRRCWSCRYRLASRHEPRGCRSWCCEHRVVQVRLHLCVVAVGASLRHPRQRSPCVPCAALQPCVYAAEAHLCTEHRRGVACWRHPARHGLRRRGVGGSHAERRPSGADDS